jgi:hypothetical protein
MLRGLAGGNYTVAVAWHPAHRLTQTYDPDSCPRRCDHQTTVSCRPAADPDRRLRLRYAGNFSISGTTFFDAGNDGGIYVNGTDTPEQHHGLPVAPGPFTLTWSQTPRPRRWRTGASS